MKPKLLPPSRVDRADVAEWGKLNEELSRIARMLGELQARGTAVKAAVDAFDAKLKAKYALVEGDTFEFDLLADNCGVIVRAPKPAKSEGEK